MGFSFCLEQKNQKKFSDDIIKEKKKKRKDVYNMSVKPEMKELIGFQIDEAVLLERSVLVDTENLLRVAKNVIFDLPISAEEMSDIIDDLENFLECRIIGDGDMKILTVSLVSEGDKSVLYDHKVLYAMSQAGLFPRHKKIIEIPYEESNPTISEGKWGRKYEHCNVKEYDSDFEFAFWYFKELGFSVEREQLQRYLVMEWV